MRNTTGKSGTEITKEQYESWLFGEKTLEEFRGDSDTRIVEPCGCIGEISGQGTEVVIIPCAAHECGNCQGENAKTGYVELWDETCPDCGREVSQ